MFKKEEKTTSKMVKEGIIIFLLSLVFVFAVYLTVLDVKKSAKKEEGFIEDKFTRMMTEVNETVEIIGQEYKDNSKLDIVVEEVVDGLNEKQGVIGQTEIFSSFILSPTIKEE